MDLSRLPHAGVPGSLELSAATFAVVDVETTGTRVWGDRVTEVAAVQVQGGEVGASWSTLVYPQRPIPHWATSLTGISDAMVRGAPPFGDVADDLRRALDGRVFVGHNATFDWRFLNAELERCTGDGFAPGARRLCTVKLARRFVRRLPRRSLDHLARYFGVSIRMRHRALGDAMATAHCLTYLLEEAAGRGIRTLDELDACLAAHRGRRRRRQRSVLPSFFDPGYLE